MSPISLALIGMTLTTQHESYASRLQTVKLVNKPLLVNKKIEVKDLQSMFFVPGTLRLNICQQWKIDNDLILTKIFT